MKTDDLIRAMAADLPTSPKSALAAAMQSLPVAIAVSALIFAVTLGLRPDFMAHWQVVAPKLLATLVLVGAALPVCMRLARPERAGSAVFASLALPLVVIAGLIVADMLNTGPQGWQARAVGTTGLYCLTMIPLLSLAPLVAILLAARCGAVTRHYIAGAIAGLTAAGIGATIYALHCTDDSPLFVALWYTLAAIIMAVVGAVACRLTVRW